MSDIAMCKNEDCPFRNNCYRFCATPSVNQCYGLFAPRDAISGLKECYYFWENGHQDDRNSGYGHYEKSEVGT